MHNLRQTEQTCRPLKYSLHVFEIRLSGHKVTVSQCSCAQRGFQLHAFENNYTYEKQFAESRKFELRPANRGRLLIQTSRQMATGSIS